MLIDAGFVVNINDNYYDKIKIVNINVNIIKIKKTDLINTVFTNNKKKL
jgi:hypothetical protein